MASPAKQILLKNAPDYVDFPIFAFPAGSAAVGTVVFDAYDYGIPIHPRTNAVPTVVTNKPQTTVK
jgi:hypothetical protein